MKMLLILAALASVSVGSPAFAEPAAPQRTATVQHSDLDLSTKAGTDRLKHRVWRAVAEVCGTTSEFDIEGKNDIRKCRRDTARLAVADADQLVADAQRGRPVRITTAQK